MPGRLVVFVVLCAVLRTALSDLHSDFLREVNEIAEAEVSGDRTIIHEKTDANIVKAHSSPSAYTVPLISKSVADDPNYKQHFLAEVTSMNGRESAHRDDDSAHAESLL